MCTLWTLLLNLSIPDVPFPVLLSTLIRSRFQAKLQPSWSPLIFPFLFAVDELYGARYQVTMVTMGGDFQPGDSFSLINVGSGFHCLRRFSFFMWVDLSHPIVGSEWQFVWFGLKVFQFSCASRSIDWGSQFIKDSIASFDITIFN
jgi:hypothetical protein